MSFSVCRAVTIRLVPTSRPMVSYREASVLLIFFLQCRAPAAETGLRFYIFLLQKAAVTGHGESAFHGSETNLLFGGGETLLHLGAARAYVGRIVFEPKPGKTRI